MIERYLQSSYKEGGRGPMEFDCWGLVRLARHQLYGLPLLPSFGAICPDDKNSLTRAAQHTISQHLQPSRAMPGAIASCWRGRLCLHVGLVVVLDGRLGVLEIDKRISPHWQRLSDFESRHLRVEYYHDQDIPQHLAE